MEKNDILDLITKYYYENTPDYVNCVSFGYKEVGGKLTDELCIIFNVDKKKPENQIAESEILPKIVEMSGYTFKTDVIESVTKFLAIEYCPSSFYTWQSTDPPNRNLYRPLRGGISVTNWTKQSNKVGTLGFLAVDNDTNSLVGVSNNHVFVLDAWYASMRPPANGISNAYLDKVTQPNDVYNGVSIYGPNFEIGTVKKYVPLSSSTVSTYYNRADAACTTINQSQIDPSSSWLQVGMTGWSQPMEFATTAEIDNLLSTNPSLFSAGRTTGAKGEGVTKLLTYATNVTVGVAYNRQGSNYVATFERTIAVRASASTTTIGNHCYFPIDSGDSGSALCADFSGVRKIIGLIYAGQFVPGTFLCTTALANRIDDVATLLNLSSWTGQTVSYSDTSAAEYYCLSSNSTDKSISITGNTFWQLGLCN